MKSRYLNYRINKPFAFSRCSICVSCSVHQNLLSWFPYCEPSRPVKSLHVRMKKFALLPSRDAAFCSANYALQCPVRSPPWPVWESGTPCHDGQQLHDDWSETRRGQTREKSSPCRRGTVLWLAQLRLKEKPRWRKKMLSASPQSTRFVVPSVLFRIGSRTYYGLPPLNPNPHSHTHTQPSPLHPNPHSYTSLLHPLLTSTPHPSLLHPHSHSSSPSLLPLTPHSYTPTLLHPHPSLLHPPPHPSLLNPHRSVADLS